MYRTNDYPATVLDLIQDAIENHNNKIAIIGSGSAVTYKEVDQRSNQLANYLHDIVGSKQTIIAVLLERSIESVITILAILKAGHIYLPIDFREPISRLNHILRSSQCKLIIHEEHLQTQIEHRKLLIAICIDILFSKIALYSDQLNHTQSPKRAYVIYTSGSTGKPKGVINTHLGLYNRIVWMRNTFNIKSKDKILQKTSLGFDVSLWEIFLPLISGATLVLARKNAEYNFEILTEDVVQNNITIIHFVPSVLRAFLLTNNLKKQKTLRYVFISGEALYLNDYERFKTLCSAKMINLYGPTEATIDVSYFICQAYDNFRIPIGRAISNVSLNVYDDSGKLILDNRPGELNISGACLADGYLYQSKMTSDKFIRRQINGKSALCYKTGDLVYRDNNDNLIYLGRIDEQCKVNGFRVEPYEIEQTIGAFKYVEYNKIVPVARDNRTELLAFVHLNNQCLLSSNIDLMQSLKERLPHYMIPAKICYMLEMPLLTSGKVDTNRLRHLYDENNQEISKNDQNSIYKNIISSILGNIDDMQKSFIQYGGNSLKAIILAEKLRKYGINISPLAIINSAELSNICKIENNAPPLKDSRNYNKQNSNSQIAVLKKCLLAKHKYLYQNVIKINIKGSIDRKTMLESLTILFFHYNDLSLHFNINEFPISEQFGYLNVNEVFFSTDMTQFENKEQIMLDIINDKIRAGFDLEKGPLLYLHLFKLFKNKYILYYLDHHCLLDGLSQTRFLDLLFHLYENGCTPKLLPKSKIESHYKHKKTYYINDDGAKFFLRFDRSTNRLPESHSHFKKINFVLKEDEVKRINELCKKENITINSLLQYCWVLSIEQYAGCDLRSCYSLIASQNTESLMSPPYALGMNVTQTPIFFDSNIAMDCLQSISKFHRAIQTLYEKARHIDYCPINPPRYGITFLDEPIERLQSKYQNKIIKIERDHYTEYNLLAIVINTNNETIIQIIYNCLGINSQAIKSFAKTWKKLIFNNLANKPNISEYRKSMLPANIDNNYLLKIYQNMKSLGTRDAIVTESNSISYEQLIENIYSHMSYINEHSKNMTTQQIIGLAVRPSIQYIELFLAIIYSGAIYSPINYDCQNVGEYDIEYDLIFYDSNINNKNFSHLSGNCVDVNQLPKVSSQKSNVLLCFDSILGCYITSTSGTTGKPKNILIKHISLNNTILCSLDMLDLSNETKGIWLTNSTFDVSIAELLLPLCVGGKIYIPKQDAKYDKDYMKKFISQFSINLIIATPCIYQLLEFSNYLSAKKCIVTGELLDKYLAYKLGSNNIVWNFYGPSEAAIWVSGYKVTKQTQPEKKDEIITIGKSFPGVVLYVVNKDYQICEEGQLGELCIAGLNCSDGYFNNPLLTGKNFKYISTAKRSVLKVYMTGDSGYLGTDKNYYVTGRNSQFIKVNGVRLDKSLYREYIHNICDTLDLMLQTFVINNSQQLCIYYVLNERTLAYKDNCITHNWISVYQETYSSSRATEATDGWINSFSKKRFKQSDLDEIRISIKQLLQTHCAQHILDIGGGKSSLFSYLDSNIKSYTLLEPSEKAINHTKKIAKKSSHTVKFIHCFAHQIELYCKKMYDTVILNSVAQYFPSIEYLKKIVNLSIDKLTDGGKLYLFDIKNLHQQQIYHKIRLLAENPNLLDHPLFLNYISYKMNIDQELWISPLFFYELKNKKNKVSSVKIHTRTLKAENELNVFRYDVEISIDNQKGPSVQQLSAQEVIQGYHLSEKDIKRLLNNGKVIQITFTNKLARKFLFTNLKLSDNEVIDSMLRLNDDSILREPYYYSNLAGKLGCSYYISTNGSNPFESVAYLYSSLFNEEQIASFQMHHYTSTLNQMNYSNNPTNNINRLNHAIKLQSMLYNHFDKRYKPYFIACLDKLPITKNGKVNVSDLPLPIRLSKLKDNNSAEHSSDAVIEKFRLFLHADETLLDNDVASFGGNSLLLIQLWHELNEISINNVTLTDFLRAKSLRDIYHLYKTKASERAASNEIGA